MNMPVCKRVPLCVYDLEFRALKLCRQDFSRFDIQTDPRFSPVVGPSPVTRGASLPRAQHHFLLCAHLIVHNKALSSTKSGPLLFSRAVSTCTWEQVRARVACSDL